MSPTLWDNYQRLLNEGEPARAAAWAEKMRAAGHDPDSAPAGHLVVTRLLAAYRAKPDSREHSEAVEALQAEYRARSKELAKEQTHYPPAERDTRAAHVKAHAGQPQAPSGALSMTTSAPSIEPGSPLLQWKGAGV
jgi:hypothetical protein